MGSVGATAGRVDKVFFCHVHEMLYVGWSVVGQVVGFIEYGMSGRFEFVGCRVFGPNVTVR